MSNLRLLDPVFGENFDTALRRLFSPAAFDTESNPLRIRLDVSEDANLYKVKADIPGVKKEDISVRVDGNTVEIQAETKRESETRGDGEKVLRSERYYGTVSRSFSLGQDIDAAKVQARYADGVLELELPKKTNQDARRIAIQ